MDKKKVGMIVTGASALLCGCPGVCILVYGAVATIDPSLVGASSMNTTQTWLALGALCMGLLMFAIPVVSAAVTFWPKKKFSQEVLDEDLPPAI